MKKTTKKDITIELNFFCDESGQLHSNSKKRYFVIGGYYCLKEDSKKIKQNYIRQLKRIKTKRNIAKIEELKSKDMTQDEKCVLLNELQTSKGFNGFAIVVDKDEMPVKIEKESIFYNYFIGLIVEDLLVKNTKKTIEENTEVFVDMRLDTRNVEVPYLKGLEEYLNVKYLFDEYTFRTTYCDSAKEYCIQAADLIANTIYMTFQNPSVVVDVVKHIDTDKITILEYPNVQRK